MAKKNYGIDPANESLIVSPAQNPSGSAVLLNTDASGNLLTSGANDPAMLAVGATGSYAYAVQGNLGGIPLPVVGIGMPVTINPTVTASLYASGQSLGGVWSLASVLEKSGGSALLHQLVISYGTPTGTPGNAPSGDVLFFNINPTAASPTPATVTDHSGFVWGSSLPNLVGRMHVFASDFSTSIAGVLIADYSSVGRLLKSSASTGLFAVFVLDGVSAPTPVGTTGWLQVTAAFLPNAN